MVGKREQMRMWGGWKGLPLPASYWPGMTAFSPEALSSLLHPACSPLLSHPPSHHLCSPPSLSCLADTIHITLHNRNISYSVSNLDVEEKSFVFFYFFNLFSSSSLPHKDACLKLLLTLNFSFCHFFTFYSTTSVFSSSGIGWLCISPKHYLCPPTRPLQRRRPC